MPFLPQEMDFLMYGLIILFNFSASLRGVVNCTEFPRVKVTLNSYRYGSPAPGPLKGLGLGLLQPAHPRYLAYTTWGSGRCHSSSGWEPQALLNRRPGGSCPSPPPRWQPCGSALTSPVYGLVLASCWYTVPAFFHP